MSILKIFNQTHETNMCFSKIYIAGYQYLDGRRHFACEKKHEFSSFITLKLFDNNKFSLLFKSKAQADNFLKEFDKWLISNDKNQFLIRTYDEKALEQKQENYGRSGGIFDIFLKEIKSDGQRDFVDSFGIMQ